MPIEVRMISKAVENAQKKVEGRNFSIRKNVLKYDDVMNVQREEIYSQRKRVLDGMDLSPVISNYIDWVAEATVETFNEADEKGNQKLNVESLSIEIFNTFGINMLEELKEKAQDVDSIIESLKEKAHEKYAEKEKEIEAEQLREIERIVMLKVVDQKWMDHIDAMDELRKGIGLQGWGQKDPVVQYRIVGTEMFDEMIEAIKIDVVKLLMNLRQQKDLRRSETAKITKAALQSINSVDGGQSSIENPEVNRTVVREEPKVGRNDPCPCGSGKKYKNCHGRNQ
jgi:preprotein translocase subunit SecA